jgi:PPOX class probable F420-dependent enzyme
VRASELDQLPAWALELLQTAQVAHLGLLDEEGGPRVLPVTFALAEGRLWSAVDRKPKRAEGKELARVRFLRRDPRAALTIDRYSSDWNELGWVQATGTVTVVPVEESSAALLALSEKYAPYRDSPPPGPLLGLDPKRLIFWRARG